MPTSATIHNQIVRRALIALAAMAASLLLVLGTAALPAQAQSAPSGITIIVNTNDDEDNADGDCSLREAIQAANTNLAVDACPAGSDSGEDAIGFDLGSSSTIRLTSQLPDIADPMGLVIDGGEGAGVTVSGGGASRVFQVGRNAEVAMERVTVSDGFLSDNTGAGIDNFGTLTLTNSTVSGNSAKFAGGIDNSGTLTLMNSTVSGNHAEEISGGIRNSGDLTLMNSTVSGNEARTYVAGIFNTKEADSTITIKNSTISSNSASEGFAGAILSVGGPVVIENSTIAENSDSASNGLGGGVVSIGSVEVGSSIISGNANGDVHYAGDTNGFNSKGYNLIGSGNAAGTFNAAGDQAGVSDPELGPLTDNGGPTFTHMPLDRSPAIDKGKASPDLLTDQRGQKRPHDDPWIANAEGGDGSDIGAVEVADLPTRILVSGVTVTEGDSGTTDATFEVRLSRPAAGSITVGYATEGDTAAAPGDYVETSGTLTFHRGDTLKTVAVPVKGDTLDEFAEGFFLNLSAEENLAGASAAATIRDDDPTPSLSVNDVTVTEPDSGTTAARFAVSLSAQSGKTVLADYSTADGTAKVADRDYVETSGTLTLRPGVTERIVAVPINSDTKSEPQEDLFLKLSGAENATVADGEGKVTISDSAPSVLRVQPSEGATGVSAGANVVAAFSKEMDRNTVNSETYYLKKDGSSEPIPAAIRYDATYRKAILDPDSKLTPGASYTATVKGAVEGIKDLLGKELADGKAWSFTVTPDTKAPTVLKVNPAGATTGVAVGAKVTATFSEEMKAGSINTNTFKLYKKGSTTALAATVTYDAATKRAVLDPSVNLERGATYRAVVSAAARDLAGNQLDQNPSIVGNQKKVWSFTIKP